MIDLNKLILECGNNRFKAIKILRNDMNLGFKEAKDIIDSAYEILNEDSNADANTILNSLSRIIPSEVNEKFAINPLGYGAIVSVWNVNHTKILRYQQEIWHEGLKEHKVITAPDKSILDNKVRVQVNKWIDNWNTVCKKKQIEDEKEASIEEANIRTTEAESKLSEVENILLSTLDTNNIVDWEDLKDKCDFNVPCPIKPIEPKYVPLPIEPNKNDAKFQPKLNFFTTIFKSLKAKAIAQSENNYKLAYEHWQNECEKVLANNNDLTSAYEKRLEKYNQRFKEWEPLKIEHFKKQDENNTKIEDFKAQYFSHDISAIIKYCEIVLDKSSLPSFMDKDFEIDYNPDNKILIIDYILPNIEAFPNIKEVKYIASRNELKETYQSSSFMEKIFDSTIYKLILRILHEEFEADVINAIDAISLNGLVNYLNKATGNREIACIATIQVRKETFNSIDIKNVDAKACFKNLKGVASSKLAGITPVKPILTINKNDRRFIDSYNVANQLDESTNLAAIPWEDFEHLIRELFEKEFSDNGGEVKVTQASRDGGVDAVAFDPDPIRGGKIVIQAKRYTNTVGVSAVRDLFGTVINEGATKGILVTTADYGPDAYEFAKNKPITLLNGGNLLHLLEKHGHKAKIDLKEAKALYLANH